MSSIAQYRNRGRAYQCTKCQKIDRKGRMVSHVLKHHVAFDRIPFTCSLCSFRCLDKQTLLEHITRYARHREEEAKKGVPDYTKVLNKAKNPVVLTEADMVQLGREESLRWHMRNVRSDEGENPLEDPEGMFEEQEEEVVHIGGLCLPKWLAADDIAQNSGYQLAALSTPTPGLAGLVPVALSRQAPVSSASMQTGASALSFQPAVQTLPSQSVMNDLPTINVEDFNDLMLFGDGNTSKLETPRLARRSPSQTPCLDERILPQLKMSAEDREDPLYQEAVGFREPPAIQEPQPKKRRVAEEAESPSSASSDVIKAIMDGAKLIADALESNTRAVRCLDKTVEREMQAMGTKVQQIASEIGRVESKINQIERTLDAKLQKEEKENTKPSSKPSLKSVVQVQKKN